MAGGPPRGDDSMPFLTSPDGLRLHYEVEGRSL